MGDTVKVRLSTIDDAKDFSHMCERIENIDIDYIIGRYVIDAKSIMGILSTTLGKSAYVKIHSTDQKVIDSFLKLISNWIVEEHI